MVEAIDLQQLKNKLQYNFLTGGKDALPPLHTSFSLITSTDEGIYVTADKTKDTPVEL